ncbi:hypothetical protein ACLB2K_035988 [Fragaria x ananassa]
MQIDLILKIPLSLCGGEDWLVWHFDKKGCYTMKSGYYVGRLVEGLEKQASGSDSGVKRGRLWCKLWSAQVPPKVSMHGWRLAQGTLPTRAALIKKKAQLPDELGSGGVGVVVRNYEGECVATFARPFQYALSAFHMEAEALRAGMLICIQQGWEDVEVESDCVNLVHALQNTDDDLSIAGRVIEDCQSLDETPVIIQDVLYEDLCNSSFVARGSGLMSPPMQVFNSINETGHGAEPPS